MSNIDDGISLTNVGEGALAEVHDMLHRMQTLAVEAANETYHTAARRNLEMGRRELLAEIDRIGSATDFGGVPLFSQAANILAGHPRSRIKNNEITLQIGAAETETLDVDQFYIGSKELLIDKTDFTSVKKANASMGYLDAAVGATNDVRGAFGAAYSHLEHTHNNLSVTAENMTGRRARAGIPTWLRNLRITRRPTSPGRCQIPCCPRQTPFPT